MAEVSGTDIPKETLKSSLSEKLQASKDKLAAIQQAQTTLGKGQPTTSEQTTPQNPNAQMDAVRKQLAALRVKGAELSQAVKQRGVTEVPGEQKGTK